MKANNNNNSYSGTRVLPQFPHSPSPVYVLCPLLLSLFPPPLSTHFVVLATLLAFSTVYCNFLLFYFFWPSYSKQHIDTETDADSQSRTLQLSLSLSMWHSLALFAQVLPGRVFHQHLFGASRLICVSCRRSLHRDKQLINVAICWPSQN